MDRTLLYLSGELDIATAGALEARLQEIAEASEGPLVLDLEELRFLGSTGVRTILTVEMHLEQSDRAPHPAQRGRACRGAPSR